MRSRGGDDEDNVDYGIADDVLAVVAAAVAAAVEIPLISCRRHSCLGAEPLRVAAGGKEKGQKVEKKTEE